MVHKVVPEVDRGQVIVQERVDILPQDTLETLEERIHKVEHSLIVKGVQCALKESIDVTGLWKRVAGVASFTKGRILEQVGVEAVKSIRDVARHLKKSYLCTFPGGFPVELKDSVVSTSPSGKFQLVWRQDPEKKKVLEARTRRGD